MKRYIRNLLYTGIISAGITAWNQPLKVPGFEAIILFFIAWWMIGFCIWWFIDKLSKQSQLDDVSWI